MAHEQLSAPRSGIDQDLKNLEIFSDEERLLFLRDTIFHPMLTGDINKLVGITRKEPAKLHGALKREKYDEANLPVPLSEPVEFVLPAVPSPLDDDPRSFDSLRELPQFIDTYFQTDEHFLMNVPQCYMVRVPKDRSPLLYTTMSECTTVVAHTPTDMYVAHVSVGMTVQLDAVMEKLAADGVSLEDVRIIGNILGDEEYGYDIAEATSWIPPDKRVLTRSGFLQLGIPEENFIGYSDKPIEASPEIQKDIPVDRLVDFSYRVRPIAEVIVTNDDIYFDTAAKINSLTLTNELITYDHKTV